VPQTGIVDFKAVAAKYAEAFRDLAAKFASATKVTD
jgi:L-2-hydroxyglutarate oxidase LhgO